MQKTMATPYGRIKIDQINCMYPNIHHLFKTYCLNNFRQNTHKAQIC